MYFRTTIVIAALLAICANAPDGTRARGALPIVSDLGPAPDLPASEPATEIYMSVGQQTDPNTPTCSPSHASKSSAMYQENLPRW